MHFEDTCISINVLKTVKFKFLSLVESSNESKNNQQVP
jgi:hypothetical protein